jgi:hypothetical protein
MDVVQAVTTGLKGVVDGMMEFFSELQGIREDDGVTRSPSDRFQAISHLDFKSPIPTIRDDDPDMDGHDRRFDVMIESYSYGGRKPRDVHRLYKYASGFKEGSTRRTVYDKAMRTATRLHRIPKEAGEVLKEIREELRAFIWETRIQKMTRLDREFEALVQGGLTHSDFRALWLVKLEDMNECEFIDKMTPLQLYRKYLNKINPVLRSAVLSKEWKIDGEDTPGRNPTTHQELS